MQLQHVEWGQAGVQSYLSQAEILSLPAIPRIILIENNFMQVLTS